MPAPVVGYDSACLLGNQMVWFEGLIFLLKS